MTGWDIPNISECIMTEPKGEITGLDEFSVQFPFAALSSEKKYFVVIRDFSFHVTDGKINMTNSKGSGEKAHKGMTLVRADIDGGNYRNVLLPNDLNYKNVDLIENEIHIYHGEVKTITNFQEINQLWSFNKMRENEILKTFQSFKNEYTEKVKVEKQTIKAIETEFFGVLKLDSKIDSYTCNITVDNNEIQLSFSNIDKNQFDKNLLTTNNVLVKTQDIQDYMVDEMLKLKNDSWLEEGQNNFDKNKFSKEIKLYGLNIYEDGAIGFYYKAGDLFWGHEILTNVGSNGRYIDSTIVG